MKNTIMTTKSITAAVIIMKNITTTMMRIVAVVTIIMITIIMITMLTRCLLPGVLRPIRSTLLMPFAMPLLCWTVALAE